MLEYEWGNPSSVMLDAADDDSVHDSDHGRQFYDHFAHNFNDGLFAGAGAYSHHHHHPHHPHHQAQQQQVHPHFLPFYDPRSAYYGSTSGPGSYPTPLPPPPHAAMLGLDAVAAGGGGGYMMVPKSEDMSSQPPLGSASAMDFTGRLGLNLGGRTYFSAADEDFVSRLYRRSSSGRPGDGVVVGSGSSPRCQAEGCGADLTHAKHYHRRHKVCEYHSKAATVVAAGLTQRFCQQCSRSHELPKTPSPSTLYFSLTPFSSIVCSLFSFPSQWKRIWLREWRECPLGVVLGT